MLPTQRSNRLQYRRQERNFLLQRQGAELAYFAFIA
jgi:hypothetical protein